MTYNPTIGVLEIKSAYNNISHIIYIPNIKRKRRTEVLKAYTAHIIYC